MADFRIKKGYDVPILGEANKETSDMAYPSFVGVCPVEFPGLKPRLDVKVNDEVKIGSPLFHDKKDETVRFLSPAGGRVTAINYGPRRVIEEIIIATDEREEHESFPKHAAAEIAGMDRDTLIDELRAGGVWPCIRRRPFNKIAGRDDNPKAIFVNCMDTAPLAGDPNFSLKEDNEAFKAGVAALSVLCGVVHVCTAKGADDSFSGSSGTKHSFSGKHPAGLTGTHIGHVSPINKGEVVWHVTARDAVLIGSLLLDGKYPTKRVVAVAGPSVNKPAYIRARMGARISDLTGGNVAEGEQRYISGNILSGAVRASEGFLGFYDDLVTVLPEGREQRFIGWMMPGFNLPSYTRTYFSGLFGGKRFKMNTNINGGHRAIIQSGLWERVVALDVFPEHLTKACMAGDIEAMEQLGILECEPEDFALCTYIDPSKTEVSQIIAEGLEMIEKDG
ncbi:MAG: Na(+)-translocating NADH-quinone reductase subunit A [Acidobacteriota bacterium]|nr:Na(+)-translocating NADH-quinone reductase subunit A [Acidobacteriota bacterium]